MKRTPLKRKSTKSTKSARSKITEKADAAFSQYIRLKYADAYGNCRCISCGQYHPWKEIQNGHYMSRRYMSTRWSEDNCRPQCVACNIFNQGAAQMFRLGLIKEYYDLYVLQGQSRDSAMQNAEKRVSLTEVAARTQTAKYSEFEISAIAEFYSKEVERLKKEKGL